MEVVEVAQVGVERDRLGTLIGEGMSFGGSRKDGDEAIALADTEFFAILCNSFRLRIKENLL